MTLNERIYNLEKMINCKIIFLDGFFTSSSLAHIKETLVNNYYCSFDKFLLILKSKGGDNVYGENFLSIREELIEPLNRRKLWILINKEVASTGTILSFSVDKLFYLDTDCKIGPIDPQIIESGESLIKEGTKIQMDWENSIIVSTNINNYKGIKTIEASMRSLKIGQIIDKKKLDHAFNYLMNINKDFRDHSDRKKIKELPDYLTKSLHDINNLVEKVLVSEIIRDLDSERYAKDFFIYGI